MSIHEPPAEKNRTAVWRLLVALLLAAGSGTAAAVWMGSQQIGNADPRDWNNVFYVLFATNEPVGLALVAAFTAGALLWCLRGAPAAMHRSFRCKAKAASLIAVAVLAVTAAGTLLVFHQYALTADENMADFQARIFLNGKIYQELPPFWQPFVGAILPTHGTYLPASHSWMSSYLPMYAAIRAAFMSVGLQWFTNPFLAGISIIAIAALARQIWPQEAWKPILAAGLLAASPQFLVMSMTAYAMPAHLALNLVWLWLYSDPNKRRFWLAPVVGVAALGLHQPFFHALFVAPFLLRLVWDRQWKAAGWFGAVYLAGAVGWYGWLHHFVPANTGGAASAFGLHDRTLLIQGIYGGMLLGWLALPLPLLAALGFARFRRMSPLLRDICASCVLTFGFYVFVRFDQAHGWGDRYFHGTLGCLVLVAVAGWDSLAQKIGTRAAATFAAAGVAAALLLQVPLRLMQAERFVRPYARAAEFMQDLKVDVVAFDPRLAWYSNDLKRNDPLLQQRPIIVSTLRIPKELAETLQRRHPNGRLISREELAAFELVTEPYR